MLPISTANPWRKPTRPSLVQGTRLHLPKPGDLVHAGDVRLCPRDSGPAMPGLLTWTGGVAPPRGASCTTAAMCVQNCRNTSSRGAHICHPLEYALKEEAGKDWVQRTVLGYGLSALGWNSALPHQ